MKGCLALGGFGRAGARTRRSPHPSSGEARTSVIAAIGHPDSRLTELRIDFGTLNPAGKGNPGDQKETPAIRALLEKLIAQLPPKKYWGRYDGARDEAGGVNVRHHMNIPVQLPLIIRGVHVSKARDACVRTKDIDRPDFVLRAFD